MFVLEGRLTHAWVNELLRITQEIAPGSGTVFDLNEVYYVDPAGEEALCCLNRRGASFAADTVYGKDLCHRLGLHRNPSAPPRLEAAKKRRRP